MLLLFAHAEGQPHPGIWEDRLCQESDFSIQGQ